MVTLNNLQDLGTLLAQGTADTFYVKAADDIVLPTSVHIEIPEGAIVDLDFNGHTLTKHDAADNAPIENHGTITLHGEGGISGNNRCINNYGTMTIDGGLYITSSPFGGTAVRNASADSIATLNGGTVRASTFAVYNMGVMVVNGGEYESTSCNHIRDDEGKGGYYAYCFASANDLTFNDGKVTGVQGALAINSGRAEVKNGEFKTVACTRDSSGCSFYALYCAGERGKVDVTVSGGTFTAHSRVAALIGNDNDGGLKLPAAVKIKGGNFTGGGADKAVLEAPTTGNLEISGGTFSADVSEYVAPTAAYDANTGKVEPLTAKSGVAAIGDTYYNSLQAAIDAAPDGAVVTVLKDTDESIILPLKSITLTSEGESKPVLTGKFEFAGGVMPEGAQVTIENLAFENISISLVAWNKTTNLDKMGGLNIRNNTFTGTPGEGGNIYAIHINNADVAVNNLTITGNVFTGCGDGDGGCVYATACGALTVTDNEFRSSTMNALTLTGKDSGEHMTTSAAITGNVFNEWAAKPADRDDGRAMRLSSFDCDVDLTGNSFVSSNLPEEYVKLTGLADGRKADVDQCYWGGEAPAADKLSGVSAVLSYYEDAAMDKLVVTSGAAAEVNGRHYATLKEAVDAAGNGGTVKLLRDVEDGSGVIINKSVTIDFGGHSYTIAKTPLAGSGDKYATQDFQLLAGDVKHPNTVVMKNGTIVLPDTTPKLKMGIQNYSNLTLDGMTLDASGNSNVQYVLSNNNGSTTLTGGTVLKAAEGNVAFDVYDYSSAGYGNVSVNVVDAAIEGKIEVSESEKAALVISGGTFDREIPVKYCAGGFLPVKNSDGTYGVKNGPLTITPSHTRLNGGGTVTLTVTPANLTVDVAVTCSVEGITVDADANGTYTASLPDTTASYTFTATAKGLDPVACTVEVTKKSSGGYLPVLRPPVMPVMPGLPFRDVDEDDWYYDAVEYVYEEGLMNGTGKNTFSPMGDTTRGMIVTILYRQSGSPRVRSDNAAWWSDARVWAMEEGISDGTNMNGKITREQLAAMLYRYAKAIGADTSARGNLNRFSDSAKISSWAVEAMQWATGEGILTGRPNGTLDPKGLATRAEVAAMFMRFDQTIG